MLRVGITVAMKSLGAFRPIEFMPLAGTETEGDQDREKGKTFHPAPHSHFPVIGNPDSPNGETFPGVIILDAIVSDSLHIRRCRRIRCPKNHAQSTHAAKP